MNNVRIFLHLWRYQIIFYKQRSRTEIKMIEEKERIELSDVKLKKKKKKKKSIQSISWGYLHDSSKVNERSVIGKQTLCEY